MDRRSDFAAIKALLSSQLKDRSPFSLCLNTLPIIYDNIHPFITTCSATDINCVPTYLSTYLPGQPNLSTSFPNTNHQKGSSY